MFLSKPDLLDMFLYDLDDVEQQKKVFPTPGIEPGPCRHCAAMKLRAYSAMRAANPSH